MRGGTARTASGDCAARPRRRSLSVIVASRRRGGTVHAPRKILVPPGIAVAIYRWNMDTSELLEQIRDGGSEAAFEEILRRYTRLVYSVGWRRLRDPSWAEDCTQEVFIQLARIAPRLRTEGELVGWLHATAHRVAIDRWRRESRRIAREQQTLAMEHSLSPEEEHWKDIAPVLDTLMQGLEPAERQALLLRYFQGGSLREVGAALGLTEDAAKMRVRRALQKLQDRLLRRGITCSIVALGALLEARSLEAAPAPGHTFTAREILARARHLAPSASPFPNLLVLMKTKTIIIAGILALAGWWISREWLERATNRSELAKVSTTATTERGQVADRFRRARLKRDGAAPADQTQSRLNTLRRILQNARRVRTYPPGSLAEELWQSPDLAREMAGVLEESLASPDYETRHWAAAGLEIILRDPAMHEGQAAAQLALARFAIRPGQSDELELSLLQQVLSVRSRPFDDLPGPPTPLAPEVLTTLVSSFEATGLDRLNHNVMLGNMLGSALQATHQDDAVVRGPLLRLLSQGDPEQKLGAAYALSRLANGGTPEVIATLRRAVDDPSERVPRVMAALGLAQLGPAAAEALPSLQLLLDRLPAEDPARSPLERALLGLDPDRATISAATPTPEASPASPGSPRDQILPTALEIARDPERREQIQNQLLQGNHFMTVLPEWVEPLRAAMHEEAGRETDVAVARFLIEAADHVLPQFQAEQEVGLEVRGSDPYEFLARAKRIAEYPETQVSPQLQQQIARLVQNQSQGEAWATPDALRAAAESLRSLSDSVYREALRSFLETHPQLDRILR